MSNVWNGRPILDRLPFEGYQNNEVTQWLIKYWDDLSLETKQHIDEVGQRQLNPETCDSQWLDYLAALAGFTGQYWSKGWSDTIKRRLINASFDFLWRRRGSRDVLEYVLETFLDNNYDVWVDGEFRADVTPVDGFLGEPEFRYFIRLPLSFRRTGNEFKIARLINRLYGAAYCDSDVTYDAFYCDFSEVDDPVFDEDDALVIEVG